MCLLGKENLMCNAVCLYFHPKKQHEKPGIKLENLKISIQPLHFWMIFHVFQQKETENLLSNMQAKRCRP